MQTHHSSLMSLEGERRFEKSLSTVRGCLTRSPFDLDSEEEEAFNSLCPGLSDSVFQWDNLIRIYNLSEQPSSHSLFVLVLMDLSHLKRDGKWRRIRIRIGLLHWGRNFGTRDEENWLDVIVIYYWECWMLSVGDERSESTVNRKREKVKQCWIVCGGYFLFQFVKGLKVK